MISNQNIFCITDDPGVVQISLQKTLVFRAILKQDTISLTDLIKCLLIIT